jgi:CheY-like chemotaxis protein
MQHSLPVLGTFWWAFFKNTQTVIFPFKAAALILAAIIREKPLHVLLADDDEDDRELFNHSVNHVAPHIKMEEVCSGEALMKRLKSKESLPDLIFLDLNMPGKHGLECLKEIRGDKKLKHLPVIIYTTSQYKEDIDNTYKNGADYYVAKPYKVAEMRQTLKTLLSLQWAAHTLRAREEFVFNYKKTG